MHDWGDKTVDWKGIEDAGHIVSTICRRYGCIGGYPKEKYGTLRFSASFRVLSLNNLIYPGYVYTQLPEFLQPFDNKIVSPVLNFFFGKAFFWWQKKVYNYAYQRALRKHPHLRAEILHDADCLELIKGASRKEGKFTYVLGWNGETLSTWESY